ncbi:spore germination protein, amino acid permease [Halobacteroides halobius DSM 5150]|uniref:Spore germination protein, amino acid permease n=1 Tax=Halobacteroides halobius (strain ATCC 35273 / DSM 5150 / MD-1) TaxID=748449 RepID=L0KBP6_HALHC|nr:GerAB/ArcD/ProY family transporter [Halobacteroides halobius]AGB42431.1 spore germination protein, amino acid permease [Halobacteroides halobius DSM 5150]
MKLISNTQFFLIVINFIIGSTILFPLGIKAKQDAYLVILTGAFLQLIMSLIYLKINSISPEDNFVQLAKKIFGKYLGWLVGVIYSTFFLYIAIRNTRDLAEQIVQNFTPRIDITSVIIFSIILVIYATYSNLSTIGRVIGIIYPFVILFLVTTSTLLITLKGDFRNLQPVLAKGFKPILKALYPGILGFPVAETAIFMMIFPKVNTSLTGLKKSFLIATTFTYLILTLNTIMMLTILGSMLTGKLTFPLIQATELLGIELLHLNFFISLVMVLSLIMKITLLTYAGLQGYSQLFKIPYKKMTLFIPPVIGYLALPIAKGYPQHIRFGLNQSLYINIVVGIYIPLLTLTIYYFKKGIKKIFK